MKIVVIDDDPTGSQSVYGCPLLLSWDQKTLWNGINHPSPLLFILANTRSLSHELAEKRIREICHSILRLCKTKDLIIQDFLFVSRGDSTLRGHGILEPQVLLEELGPFNSTFHIPAFFEGGRTTVNKVHFLNGVPVHTTDFAKDRVFGYSTSDLSEWLSEKSNGKIQSEDVEHISLLQLNYAFENDSGLEDLINYLLQLDDNKFVIVDAKFPQHLEILADAIKSLSGRKRFIFRSAASFISALARLPLNSKTQKDLANLRLKDINSEYKPGLIVVGSFVQLADNQLQFLSSYEDFEFIELPINKIFNFKEDSFAEIITSQLTKSIVANLSNILSSGKTPVLYTSRGEIDFKDDNLKNNLGLKIAQTMAFIVGEISSQLGYIISKGGITTQVLLKDGLGLSEVFLEGQILPGLSIVTLPENCKNNKLPIVTFPGNLGNKFTLFEAWKIMQYPDSNY